VGERASTAAMCRRSAASSVSSHRARRRRGRRAHLLGEQVGRELGALGDDHRALEHVHQLALVARPGVGRQRRQGRRGEREAAAAVLRREVGDDALREVGEVFAPLAQREGASR
jgi:hypothetical protein